MPQDYNNTINNKISFQVPYIDGKKTQLPLVPSWPHTYTRL